jgi:hypothetical protein
MSRDLVDPLLLGQRVVAILETGQRDATYKLATLMALIEHCIENLPAHPEDTLPVPIPELAHRVLAIYWRQVRPSRDTNSSNAEPERTRESPTPPKSCAPPHGPATRRCR